MTNVRIAVAPGGQARLSWEGQGDSSWPVSSVSSWGGHTAFDFVMLCETEYLRAFSYLLL